MELIESHNRHEGFITIVLTKKVDYLPVSFLTLLTVSKTLTPCSNGSSGICNSMTKTFHAEKLDLSVLRNNSTKQHFIGKPFDYWVTSNGAERRAKERQTPRQFIHHHVDTKQEVLKSH
jgi:hypothetical protein